MEIQNLKNYPLFVYEPKRKVKQDESEFVTEFLSYLSLFAEIIVNTYIGLKVKEYFTYDDDEAIAIMAIGAIHISFVIIVAIFHFRLIQYIRDHDSVTLKEFDTITRGLITGLIEELFMLVGCSLVTYYVIYEIEYIPAINTMITIQIMMTVKSLINIIHFT